MRKHHLLTPILLGLGLLVLANLRSADRCGDCGDAGPGIGAGNGAGLVSAVGGLAQWQCVGSRARNLREWRAGRRHSSRKQILSRFPPWDVPLYGALIRRPPDRCRRHCISGARNADLSRNRMVGKLAGGLPRGRL